MSLCVSRKCAFAACNRCSIVTNCAHLHAPQHPWVGAPGRFAMSILLHRYGELSHHFFITGKIISQLVHIAMFCFVFSSTVYIYAEIYSLLANACTLIHHTLKNKCNRKNKLQKVLQQNLWG